MSGSDIENMARNNHACPNVRKGVRLLAALVEAVNRQSDGWSYWSPPSKAAEQLCQLLRTAGNVWYDTRGTITEAELRKAIAPIRAMAKHQKELQAKHGNRFEFDVDAALEPKAETDTGNWHTCKTGNHQGLVISETGLNIAVTYHKADAPLVAAAPAMLAALRKIDANAAESPEWIRRVTREAIQQATEETI